jgi:hypothetical protein
MPVLGIIASQISGHLFAPSGAYDSIATVSLSGGSSSSISFTSIPSTYKHLQLRITGLSTAADGVLNLNGNNANYSHLLYGDGATTSSAAYASQGYIDAGNGAGTYPSVYVIDILDYADTNKYKTVRDLFGYDFNGSGRVGMNSMGYNTTSAVTSLSLTGRTWGQYSSFALYGIRGN